MEEKINIAEIVKDEKGNAKKRIRNISMDVKMF